MRFLTFLLFLFLFLVTSASAQKGYFVPGFIIRGNDTIPGFIERNAEADLGRSIKYKLLQNSDTKQEYLPSEISGFGFSPDSLWFEAVEVEIKDEAGFRKTRRFAKVILKGQVSLYKVQLQRAEYNPILLRDNTHVYVIKKDSTFYTLGQYEYQSGKYVGLHKRYIGTLNYTLANCPDVIHNINSLRFDDRSITRLIREYNRCASPETTIAEYTHKVKAVVRHGVEAGYTWRARPTDNYRLSGYSVGYFWEINNPDRGKRIAAKLGLSYAYLESGATVDNNELKHVSHTLKVPITAQYNLGTSPQATYLPFVYAGVSPYFFLREKHMATLLTCGAGLYVRSIKITYAIEKEGLFKPSPTIAHVTLGLKLSRNK
ncbi:hypothetical protein [Pontibacter ruber]|uniref:Uncharacterized protein n=1 Tax=Pontibacter ruber TaxID=1343895 RepID=A0ABW5CUM5_9BACT|nr:hypothetical protein [Pontibacter ruber]